MFRFNDKNEEFLPDRNFPEDIFSYFKNVIFKLFEYSLKHSKHGRR